MKIRTRLCMAFLILVGFGLYKLIDWITDDLRPRYLETMEESMVDTATILSSYVEQGITNGAIDVSNLRSAFDTASDRRFEARIYELTKTNLNIRVYVTDNKGIVIFDSENGRDEGKDYVAWNDVRLTLRGKYGARTTRTDPDDPKTASLYVAAPLYHRGEMMGVLTICKPVNSVTLFLLSYQRKIMVAGIIAGVVVILLGMAVSSWITHPINKLIDYARAVRDGERVTVPYLGRSEIGELGRAFEEMRDALEGKQYVENYVQTLTHEMKSPLSAIHGAAELLEEDMSPDQRKRFIRNIRAESARIKDLVDRLLQLSALEKRKGLRDVEEIDIADLCREVHESLSPVLSGKNVSLIIKMAGQEIVRGEKFLIRQALVNLLDNAIDFSPVSGEIELSVEPADSNVVIKVADRGPGIPEYATEKIFDRFYSLRRPDTGKKSSGLGLTFVLEVALLHGGKVDCFNRPGGGAIVILSLPKVPNTATV